MLSRHRQAHLAGYVWRTDQMNQASRWCEIVRAGAMMPVLPIFLALLNTQNKSPLERFLMTESAHQRQG